MMDPSQNPDHMAAHIAFLQRLRSDAVAPLERASVVAALLPDDIRDTLMRERLEVLRRTLGEYDQALLGG